MKGERRSCSSERVSWKKNGCQQKVQTFSYVVTLCEKDGSEVMALRLDGFERILDARKEAEKLMPEWNIKEIRKLYNSDFDDAEVKR